MWAVLEVFTEAFPCRSLVNASSATSDFRLPTIWRANGAVASNVATSSGSPRRPGPRRPRSTRSRPKASRATHGRRASAQPQGQEEEEGARRAACSGSPRSPFGASTSIAARSSRSWRSRCSSGGVPKFVLAMAGMFLCVWPFVAVRVCLPLRDCVSRRPDRRPPVHVLFALSHSLPADAQGTVPNPPRSHFDPSRL